MNNLQLLEFYPYFCVKESDVQSLANLRCLKVLKLNFNALSFASMVRALVANGIQIERFKIDSGEIDEDGIKTIALLKNLAVLEFYFTDYNSLLTDEHLMTIAKVTRTQFDIFRFTTWRNMSKGDVNACESIVIIDNEIN